jgi:hypothetical protein
MNFARLLLVTVSIIVTSLPLHSATLIDQSYFDGCCLTTQLAEEFAYTGQTVTSGKTGRLVRVELEASRRFDFNRPWILDIQEVTNGKPNGTILSTTLIKKNAFPINTGFQPLLDVTLKSPVFFKKGEMFAIVLHPKGVKGELPNLFAGIWSGGCWVGDNFSCYEGGQAFVGPSSNKLFPQEFDLNFRTHVSPVPLPAAFWFFGSGLLALMKYKRSRS